MTASTAEGPTPGHTVRICAERVVPFSAPDVERVIGTPPPQRISQDRRQGNLEWLESRPGAYRYRTIRGTKTTFVETRRIGQNSWSIRTETKVRGRLSGFRGSMNVRIITDGAGVRLLWDASIAGARWWNSLVLRLFPGTARRSLERSVDRLTRDLSKVEAKTP